MKYKRLGRTDLYVSELCLGTMTLGGNANAGMLAAIGAVEQGEANRLITHALAQGINFIDTADIYSFGQSEHILGQALRDLGVPRSEVVLATKTAGVMGLNPNDQGASRGHIMDSVQRSLERLQVDHIAGWAYLTLATVHIYYGKSVAVDTRRLAEITALSKIIAKNAAKLSGAPQYEPGSPPLPDNLIILGDFNIFNRQDVTMEAITQAGFVIPEALKSIPGSNVAKNKHYDQLAYYKRLARLTPTGKAGVFDFFEQVYRIEDEAAYAGERAEKLGRSFKDWRTYRMSDHLPMWIELGIDDSDAYLNNLV